MSISGTGLPAMDLTRLQREMAAAVMQPLTENDEMRAIAPDGRAMNDVAQSFIAPNSRLSSFERLEIYNRQYWFRVLGSLAEDFPALRAVVGEARFQALSIAYLTANPSRSFTLRNLGSKLTVWLAANPQFCGRRQRLALDVARIEWAGVEAFDNAESLPLTLEQIATLDAGSRLAVQPYLQLIALEYAADDLVLALHDGERREASEAGVKHQEDYAAQAKPPRPRLRPTWLAIHRMDLAVYYRRIRREEFLTLESIRDGLPLADAMEAGFRGSQSPVARRPELVREWFADWAELGWICGRDLDRP